jgi:mevalonate kinase
MTIVSAPGKIHLMGEHAVVYGKPALLAAINRRLTVSVQKGRSGVEIVSDQPESYVRHIISLVLKEYRISGEPDIVISISSEVPAGYHLGSSAAVAVATIGALSFFLKKIWNPIAINKLAFEAEKQQHGNPSGGDNTIVTFGGIVWYRRELEFLKSIWQLPFRPHKNLSHFMLINTGKPRESTKDMVRQVKSDVENPESMEKMEHLFDENEKQTRRIAAALKEGSEDALTTAMRAGEKTLEGMRVVSDTVIPLIRAVEKEGGAAKILGGGGREGAVGYLLAYHPEPKCVQTLAGHYHYNVEPITLGEEGVRLDEK